jgi:Chromo (CHRromatin Organisation MOdifier) domain
LYNIKLKAIKKFNQKMPTKRRKRFSTRKMTKSPKAQAADDDKNDSDTDTKFEIDFIEDHRINSSDNKIEFRVRWRGYGEADDTWEDFELFAYDAPQIVSDYLVRAFASNPTK